MKKCSDRGARLLRARRREPFRTIHRFEEADRCLQNQKMWLPRRERLRPPQRGGRCPSEGAEKGYREFALSSLLKENRIDLPRGRVLPSTGGELPTGTVRTGSADAVRLGTLIAMTRPSCSAQRGSRRAWRTAKKPACIKGPTNALMRVPMRAALVLAIAWTILALGCDSRGPCTIAPSNYDQ